MIDSERTERPRKYAPLGEHLRRLPGSVADVTFDFVEIEKIVGEKLPPSALEYREWWANQEGGSRAPHWRAAGFKVDHVDLGRRIVSFRRLAPALSEPPRAMTLQEVVTAVNDQAQGRPIGGIQEWRKTHKGKTRLPSATLFYSEVEPGRDFAFHVGGLSELQFNVGFEPVDEVRTFRHDAFEGLSMWHWPEDDDRSDNYPVAPVPDELVEKGFFIFIGRLQPADEIRVDLILNDFDRLLPVYEYVEGTEAFPTVTRERRGFVWSPGNKARPARTSFERTARTVEKSLRHNVLQDALFNHLEEIHGFGNTSGEQNCGIGTLIDVAVRDGKSFVYYEIKTGLSAQACIREALGQLMEYSYWPGAQKADRLVIVGEARCDKEAKTYIERLRKDFSLPIEYRQLDMKSRRLI